MSKLSSYSFLIDKRVVLVRFGGELGIKSHRTRKRMLNYLQNDIKSLLSKNHDFKILIFRDRLLIFSKDFEKLVKITPLIASSISGVSSVSIALVVESKEKKIILAGVNEAKAIIKSKRSFAVRAQREGNHSFTSLEIASKVGAAILATGVEGLSVDLERPDYKIFLDIRGQLTFIYTKVLRGMDGIPSKTQGIAFALIRPNLNSLIASWLMKKRGIKIIPIVFKTGKSSEKSFNEEIQFHFGKYTEVINIKAFLENNKHRDNLCFLCQALCERLCTEISKKASITNVISPTCFNFNNETISLEALKILEKNASVNILRPIQLGYYGDLLNITRLDRSVCCPYQKKVHIIFNSNSKDSDLDIIRSYANEKLIQKSSSV